MPKIEDYGKNPLMCQDCNEYMSIAIEVAKVREGNIEVKMPTYSCKKCDKKEYFNWRKFDIYKKTPGITNYPIKPNWVEIYKQLGFIYDFLDYYCIPGLYRDFSDDGHLTPVFFNKDLLLYYNNHPDYKVNLSSYSSGDIDYKGESFLNWGFGINKSNKIFMRLGDLYDLFKDGKYPEELHRFRASNLDSDHEVVSDYYFNQIEAVFTDSDNERKIFDLYNSFNQKFNKKFGFNIFQVDIKLLELGYKSPILDEKHQVFDSYSQLSKLLIEAIDVSKIKKLILNKKIANEADLKDKGGLKILEMLSNKVLKIDSSLNILCPLYVLYDLRGLSDHLSITSFESTYDSCKSRLEFQEGGFLEFHKCVIIKIIEMFNVLIKEL